MGSFLSKPVTEKVSSNQSNNNLNCGISSMQGWRLSQEDAHNCILDYDTNTSYFAVYDGHGGHEVALYCSENLPQFLKEMEVYKSGNIKKALEEAFLEFDATITTPDILDHLKKLASDRPDNEESEKNDTVSENCDNLNTQPEEKHSLNESSNNLNHKAEGPLCDDTDNIVNSSIIAKNEEDSLKIDKSDKDETVKEKEDGLTKMDKPIITAQQLYKSFLEYEAQNEEDDSDNDDENPNEESSEDDENINTSTDEQNSKNSSDDDDQDDHVFIRNFTCNMRDEPGFNSGCTAVVALLRENELYVANAGDSRCIVCRNGKAIEMSFDHKPINDEEYKRIINAGGRITDEDRVNGGLNLSRAIGDHAYKQNANLSNREQMITALPDVQTFTIHPNEDEFMFLACDGIWNCMSNQEVVDFIRPAIKEGKKKLSQICEEMFDKCLASSFLGNGNDNMTAIIVQFTPHLLKRPAEELGNNKRLKAEESADTTVV